MKKKHISPVHLIPGTFIAAIMIGTMLLMMPVCTAAGNRTGFLTALFTATTSVCVTGLVVVDTYAHWSFWGQLVILILVQLGGLGIVTVVSTFMLMARRKFSLGDRRLLKDAMNLDDGPQLLQFLRNVIIGTFLVEGVGAVLYMIDYVPRFGWKKGIWASVFQGVSAFCNAGMDVVGADSMISFQFHPLLMSVTILLIILGGLGYVAWFDILSGIGEGIRKRFSPRQVLSRLPEHTRLVLQLTIFLLLGGMLFFFVAEYRNPDTLGGMDTGGKLLNALFQSVTLRTAGFASVPQDKLSGISCVAAYILMFIGGSPIGTAGGVKTVTVFLVFMNVRSYISGRSETVVFRKRISEDLMRKAAAVVSVSLATVLLFTILLMATNPVALEDALYEVVSASATVGLSRGLTPNLNTAGRVIIIAAMYLGRIGPISMAIFFSKNATDEDKVRYSDGRFYVG